MSCILYKDGKVHKVKAEFVEYMIKRGYSSSKEKSIKRQSRPTKKEETQADLALAGIDNEEKQAS